MCGFTGFVGAIENKEQVLENMMNTIVHRGPDSAGTFLDDDAALGFRRLSIIDRQVTSRCIMKIEQKYWYLMEKFIIIRN